MRGDAVRGAVRCRAVCGAAAAGGGRSCPSAAVLKGCGRERARGGTDGLMDGWMDVGGDVCGEWTDTRTQKEHVTIHRHTDEVTNTQRDR